ncbi:hypothetical protein DDN72_17390, partial [Vibrio cholerae]|nr:hypothetical protein [Vibrio cholerae]
MTIQFTQTPVEQIVDQYIAAFPKVDTVALEKQIRDRAKAFEEGNASQFINIFDTSIQTVEKIDNTPYENGEVISPLVSLIRVKGCTRYDWYQLISELLANGYTVNNNHSKYFGNNEMVV